MTKNADITFRDDKFYLSGDLDFVNVMSVLDKSKKLFANQNRLILNFSEVTSSNSAGLALLMEWIKLAKSSQQSLQVEALPKDLSAIAAAAGVDQLITIA